MKPFDGEFQAVLANMKVHARAIDPTAMAADMENAAEERDKATEEREAQEQFRRSTLSLTTIDHNAANIVVAEVHMQQSAKARDFQEAFTKSKSLRYISHLSRIYADCHRRARAGRPALAQPW